MSFHWSLFFLIVAVLTVVATVPAKASPSTELAERDSRSLGKRFPGWQIKTLHKWLDCYLKIVVRVTIEILSDNGSILYHQQWIVPYYIYADLNPDHILSAGTITVPENAVGDFSTDVELDGTTFTEFAARFENPVTHEWINETFGHCGIVRGDPHLNTFDGYKYNFNGFCSYVLTKSCDTTIPKFQINADFRSTNPNTPYEPPTRMVAFDVYNYGKLVVRINHDNSILINGKRMVGNYTVIGNTQGTVTHTGPKISVELTRPAVSLNWDRNLHGITIEFEDDELYGKVCGLLGDADGDPNNDFVMSDGTRTLDSNEFGNSWMVPGSCPI
ncbi:hemocytin-like [Saccoglossus kowalevskii]|uniref:von Willebrand type d domain containing protein-like m22 n=2 Tax=Saccoglossus kowalevskii TaxID=10224 RepID=A0A0U2T2Q4_SACKO|nr:von Willebrand type d domain containing protein-like m22 [Saccoglossus kowalevskii]